MSLPELSRIRLWDSSLNIKPKEVFFLEEMSSTRLARALNTNTPASNSRTEPSLIVTPSWPLLNTPMSQNSFRGLHPAAGVPSPSIRWPLRSRVMSSAPITIPWFGQSRRSRSSVVSAVIVSPQLGCVFAASAPFNVRRPSTVKASTTASKRNVAGAAWSEAWLASLSSPYPGRARPVALRANLPQASGEHKAATSPTQHLLCPSTPFPFLAPK